MGCLIRMKQMGNDGEMDEEQLRKNAAILKELRWIAWVLEGAVTFKFFDTKMPWTWKTYSFGLSSVITFVPLPGFISANLVMLLTCWIVLRAWTSLQPPLSNWVMCRVMMNLVIGGCMGYVPLFGAMLLVWWKPNQTNVELIARNVPSHDKLT